MLWRSRRGLLELDLYLTPFAEACYPHLSPEQQLCYAEMLNCEDVDILQWLKDESSIPVKYRDLIKRIKDQATNGVLP